MTSLRPWILASAVTLAACGGSTPAEAPAPEADAPAAEPLGDQLEADDMEGADQKYALVPSPAETQAALEKAGIDTKLATLVPERSYKLEENDTDRVAVRTGVVVADMLLTVKTSSDETLLGQLAQIRSGMQILEGGKDILATIDDLVERIQAKAVTRDQLLTELDELSNVVIPELEFNGRERVVPLIQAGSWLAGSNLVAKAVKDKGDPTAADGVLKQPTVVKYFRGYAKDQAEGAVGSAVQTVLDGSLSKLEAVAAKSEPLTAEDIDTVISSTDAVFALL